MSEIDDALGLNPITPYRDITQYPPKRDDSQQENDLDFARENLYDAVVKSQAAVEDMIQIAQQSQHPKAYEVLNSLIICRRKLRHCGPSDQETEATRQPIQFG
jgi:hypothetical protein